MSTDETPTKSVPVKISIPTALRSYTGGLATVELDATTVGGALERLTTTHTALNKHLRDTTGKLRSFVNVYLNDEDIRFLPEKETTALRAGDSLIIVPSIAGGRS